MPHGYILRSHYVVLICSNLISAQDTNLNPVEFGWNSEDSVFIPNKCIATLPEIYKKKGCKKKMHWQMSVHPIWRFMHRILQV